MASLNKVILIGNLGADPEVKFMTSGDAVCNLSLATTDTWRDKNSGEQRESTEWHRLTLYRRLAEIAGDYLKKGSQIYVEGRIKTRKWQDKDGNDRYTTDIEVNELKMLGRREGGGSEQRQQSGDGDPFAPPQQPAKQGNRSARTVADLDDDIPF